MEIVVNVRYREDYLPPRCRTIRTREVSEAVTVAIREVAAASVPLAITAKKNVLYPKIEFLAYGGQFWVRMAERNLSLKGSNRSVSNKQIIEQIQRDCYFSVYGDREAAVFHCLEVAKNYLSINRRIHARKSEPCYKVKTFGMGCNHGGTALMSCDTQINDPSCFSLLELESAIKSATTIAKKRGDTKSIPIKPSQAFLVHRSDLLRYRRPGTEATFNVTLKTTYSRTISVKAFDLQAAKKEALRIVTDDGDIGVFDDQDATGNLVEE